MRKSTMILGLVLTLSMFSTAFAEMPDGAVRVRAIHVDPQSSFSGVFDVQGQPTPATISAQSSAGLAFGWEIAASERIGIETDIAIVDVDFELASQGVGVDFGSALMIPMTLSVQWHLTNSKKVDLYVGPMASYTLWGNLENDLGAVSLDGDFGFGVRAGLDVPMSESWALSTRLDYFTAAAADPSASIDVDPLIVGLGLAYRY